MLQSKWKKIKGCCYWFKKVIVLWSKTISKSLYLKHWRLEYRAIQGCILAIHYRNTIASVVLKFRFNLFPNFPVFYYSTVICFCIFFIDLLTKNLEMLTNYFPYIIRIISICDVQSVDICPSPSRLQHACKYRYQSTFSGSIVT